MKSRLFLVLISLSMLLLLNACRTKEYYQDRAVQKARNFLLHEDRTLNLSQREYVKFNKPVIMAADLLGIVPEARTSGISSVQSHVCIAWVIPDKKDAYVVFGVSDNRLRGWYPNRVVIKRYDIPIYDYHKSKEAAINYAMNNFQYLSPKQLNRIRFTVPETIVTDYKFGKETMEAYRLTPKALDSLVQTTFVWPSDNPDHKIFVCGVGAKDLNGWRPIFGGETLSAELKKHYLQTVSFGQFEEKESQALKGNSLQKSEKK
jgi:hypothetical protein